MPKAKKTAAAAPMTKSDFIRKFSLSTPASDIVTKAKGVNLKLTPSFVYAIRAMDKKRKRVPSAGAAKPAAASAPAATGRKINKSAFVRGLPSSMSAADVVAKGKAAGIKLSAAQVYTVRANAKRSGVAAPKASAAVAVAPLVPKPKGKPGPKPKAAKVAAPKAAKKISMSGDHEQTFARLVLNIGLTKAEALLERVRDKVNSL